MLSTDFDRDDLDAGQLEAVEASEPEIAVLAGPGSGKTLVLSMRARHLLHGDRGSSALLLTFTNKAAAEMKARAIDAASVPSRRLHAYTFHTLAAELLRSHGSHVGIAEDFDILDDEEADEIASSVHFGLFAAKRRAWSRSRLRRENPGAQLQKMGRAYEDAKRGAGVVDYDDLVVYAAQLLDSHPSIAQAYGNRYAHLLIDEFQDTNAAQFSIVRTLVGHARTVSVFADDDQAIYGFAGADLANVARFTDELGARGFTLTVNYRCRQGIVDCANRLLAADPLMSDRRMTAAHAGGDTVAYSFDNMVTEAQWIAEDVASQIAGGSRPEDIGILVRNRKRGEDTLRALIREGLPVTDWLGEVYNPQQRRTLRTCLSVVSPTLSDRQRQNLCELFHLSDTGQDDARTFLEEHRASPGVKDLLEIGQMVVAGASALEILEKAQSSVESVDAELAAALDVVVENVKAFNEHDAEFTVEQLRSELALGGSSGSPTAGGGVKVATMHRTKGLQWPQVYLLGLEEGTLPFYKCETEEEFAAERRVCFVGACRAEERLVMTAVKEYMGYPKRPSRFLGEMGLLH